MNTPRKRNRFFRLVRFAAFLLFLALLAGKLVSWASGDTGLSPYLMANPDERPSRATSSNANPNQKIRIVIDPGHGGKDPGAVGKDGKMEKHYTLSLGLKAAELLRQDSRFEIKMTRIDDTFVELEDRAQLANEWQADALISIHGNTYKDPAVGGTETYYRYENGLPLAESLHRQVVQQMGFRDREVREDRLKVLTLSEMPAALVEIGYLTNPGEEAEMLGAAGQARAAQAIADGVRDYFNKQP